jgi:putative endonuclease
MYYVYVLFSTKDNKFYTGFTDDLKRRIAEHNSGGVQSTVKRRPLKLVYYESCLNKKDALHREKYLKTTFGKQYIRNRIKHFLSENCPNT